MSKFFHKLFKVEQKYLKKIEAIANKVDALKDTMSSLADDDFAKKTIEFRERISNGESLDNLLPEAFAVCREAAKRVLNQYPYFVQIMGAIILHQGDVAEMKTGEGKTLTATMAVYLNALEGKGVHVVTVNEYLASRDAEWMGQLYKFLGLTVGINLRELTASEKREAFLCDITYTTNSEVGFDYLRDNMANTVDKRVLRGMNFAVIDEADSILIDESRTPLIISGGKRQTANLYNIADRFAKSLRKDRHFEIDIKQKSVYLKEEGVTAAEKAFSLNNLYDVQHAELVHHIQQALKANYAMQKDVEYMVTEGEIHIIDSFTGRVLKGREFSDGLHQALQAKENVKIKEETITLATITYQNLFRMYTKLSGMTGTAKTEEEEFLDIYNMRVIVIPTNKPILRVDDTDLIFVKRSKKLEALVEEVKNRHRLGQPVLIGTVSVESSEEISKLLTKEGLRHNLLNAKNHAREADIIANAGKKGAITLATNMAGRGTDIKIDEEVRGIGGLAVLGSERHESRRIDNQLRGRSGRQGDPGYSRFFISFDDELLLRFGDGRIIQMLKSQIEKGDGVIESKSISKMVTNAQTQVEGFHFDIRKNLIGYDDVLCEQRKILYAERDKIMESDDPFNTTKTLFNDYSKAVIKPYLQVENKEEIVELDQLEKFIKTSIIENFELNKKKLVHAFKEDVSEEIADKLLEQIDIRRKDWGEEIFKQVQKLVLLKVFDSNWQKHIDRMSKLRDGINLRSYAQTNPLQAYITEGFKNFEELRTNIAGEYVFLMLKAQVNIQRNTPEPKKEVVENQPKQEQKALKEVKNKVSKIEKTEE